MQSDNKREACLIELNNLLARSIPIGTWWWLWSQHLCIKFERRWWR